MSNTPLTKDEITAMAKAWYNYLDVHAPMVDFIDMLSTEELRMVFPEATLTGLASFEAWYQGVIRIFFDEVHNVKSVESVIDGDAAVVKIIVQWEASKWTPPARYSDRIKLDAYQTWTVKRSAKTGRPVITEYTVDELKYHDGSARL
jgi:hypothetical protein